MARRTPAAVARSSTLARSGSKLSCVRLAPISMRSNIASDCDDRRRGRQRRRVKSRVMPLTKFWCAIVATAGACLAPIAMAEQSAELSDLAGRIDYGFYVDDACSIESTQPALLRMSDDDRDVRYHRG